MLLKKIYQIAKKISLKKSSIANEAKDASQKLVDETMTKANQLLIEANKLNEEFDLS